MLTGSPRLDDLELIASELMTNAIKHTASGYPGGGFTLTIEAAADRVRVGVEDGGAGGSFDGGGPDGPLASALAGTVSCATLGEVDTAGRGLMLISALADKAGHEVGTASHLTWAEVVW